MVKSLWEPDKTDNVLAQSVVTNYKVMRVSCEARTSSESHSEQTPMASTASLTGLMSLLNPWCRFSNLTRKRKQTRQCLPLLPLQGLPMRLSRKPTRLASQAPSCSPSQACPRRIISYSGAKKKKET